MLSSELKAFGGVWWDLAFACIICTVRFSFHLNDLLQDMRSFPLNFAFSLGSAGPSLEHRGSCCSPAAWVGLGSQFSELHPDENPAFIPGEVENNGLWKMEKPRISVPTPNQTWKHHFCSAHSHSHQKSGIGDK